MRRWRAKSVIMQRIYIEERARRHSRGAGRPHGSSEFRSLYGKQSQSISEGDSRGCERIRYGVPRGYSVRHWDASEKPVVVGATVFDSNSFGKWIFDWSVRLFGSASRAADVAGELWLALIRLSGKVVALEASRSGSRAMRRIKGDAIALSDQVESMILVCEKATQRSIRRTVFSSSSEAVASQFVRQFLGSRSRMEGVVLFIRSVKRWETQFVDLCGSSIR